MGRSTCPQMKTATKPKFEKLNLGCGRDTRKGFVNLDMRSLQGVDVVHDLNEFPYPFPDNSFSYIYSRNCLEQLFDMRRVLDELYRISRPNAILEISVFHFSSVMAFTEYNHTFFRSNSFWTFRDRFETLDCRIHLSDKKTFPIRILEWWINKHKKFYEKTCLKSLIPAYQLHFRLRVKN